MSVSREGTSSAVGDGGELTGGGRTTGGRSSGITDGDVGVTSSVSRFGGNVS